MKPCSKKETRKNFKDSVFTRDEFCCKCCGKPDKDRQDWNTGVAIEGFSIEELYLLIGSSEEKAIKDDISLK